MTFPDDLDVFVNEDVSKPENRVNLALFSLMQQTWFREWFLMKLELARDAVVYPAKTQEGTTKGPTSEWQPLMATSRVLGSK